MAKMRNSRITKSENHSYTLRALLRGQEGAVACLAAHPLGTHVACGGKNFQIVI